jgi:hypothetical protein
MSDDEFHRVTEIERGANGKPTHFAMDEDDRVPSHRPSNHHKCDNASASVMFRVIVHKPHL